MILLVAITGRDCSQLITKLQALLPEVKVQLWSECTDYEAVEFVLAWNAPADLWPKLVNLKAVSSFGAGVDSIDLTKIAAHVPVVRIVDDNLANDMAEYVLTHVLAHKLRLKEYYLKQSAGSWKPKRAYSQQHVGILGYGELGKACAKRLLANGFKVSAWSNSEKHDSEVDTYYTQHGLDDMLGQIDYLVCLLPLSQHTQGIINKSLISKLQSHTVLINVARGKHVVDEDLLEALDNEQLRGATLDVLSEEPLPNTHPYWSHDKVTLTPHCAALSDIESVTLQISDNVKRLIEGKNLMNQIDRTKGY
ncbi:glyoxylate/hydroxypyruvate reductase A [Pseudoalteromonas sp. MEBiC 03607]|uniref:2-hydroxyacid dehydrogenase n=1 Tax=Pseudoalteromonas sp. MEBiC 03607 TaxID=2563601 RepID=UPI001093A0FA|nr:glyoxylate/hydroxypyruvate reductase A [Pseudoalteromonas sp. MEBiC 03607]TGV21046.1 glyoxylate/hydroxypyruvate reductase A [Pseudoalteromonas sp. MEBiC 03607]